MIDLLIVALLFIEILALLIDIVHDGLRTLTNHRLKKKITVTLFNS